MRFPAKQIPKRQSWLALQGTPLLHSSEQERRERHRCHGEKPGMAAFHHHTLTR